MSKQMIFEMMKESISIILPDIEPDQLSIDDSLKEIGANSVDRMDIIIDMMEKLDIKIPLIEFGELKNMGEIVDLLFSKKGF
ncbi:acyl carrier protein [Lacrimispora sp. 38-1]|uniref:acyl carrier protein n=1 Tax=Lacrimispora sp. 38-1 TaxID=3125778 RepID=UPI003CF862CC